MIQPRNMESLTELERTLYNYHLRISRSSRNKPFKLKKQFEDLSGTEKHTHLKRLAVLVKKHPEIDLDTFFEAPYKLYPDVEYFGLDYFSSMRAIKSYTMYKKMTFLQDPDTQIESVKKSLRFMANFCIQNNILLHQYPHHRTADMFTWMVHYKENKINIYSMMEFRDIYSAVQSLAEDVRAFFVSDFVDQFKNLYTSYNKSQSLKPFLKKAVEHINNFVSNELTKTKNKAY